MKKLLPFIIANATIFVAQVASAQSGFPTITQEQARAIIAPLYATFSQPVQGDVGSLLTQATTNDWQSCGSETECRNRETSVKVFTGFGKALPNMKHVIKEVIVSGDVIVVRGELSGTPVGAFFGVPYTGKSFTIMTFDKHVVRDGKLAHTFHIEDWASAIKQLSAK